MLLHAMKCQHYIFILSLKGKISLKKFSLHNCFYRKKLTDLSKFSRFSLNYSRKKKFWYYQERNSCWNNEQEHLLWLMSGRVKQMSPFLTRDEYKRPFLYPSKRFFPTDKLFLRFFSRLSSKNILVWCLFNREIWFDPFFVNAFDQ